MHTGLRKRNGFKVGTIVRLNGEPNKAWRIIEIETTANSKRETVRIDYVLRYGADIRRVSEPHNHLLDTATIDA